MLLERVLAPMKAAEHAAPWALPDGASIEWGRDVRAGTGTAAGEPAPGQGAALLEVARALAESLAADEPAGRFAAPQERTARACR